MNLLTTTLLLLTTVAFSSLPAEETAAAEQTIEVAGLEITVPSTWKAVQPKSPMRRGQWEVPGEAGMGEAALFYFGAGQGGDAKSNLVRWQNMVKGDDGQPARAEISEREVNGVKISQVESYGTYMSGMPMPGVKLTPLKDHGLLGGIWEGPQGAVFIRLTGPEATIKASVADFTLLLNSVRLKE